jgi:hypothetical protein
VSRWAAEHSTKARGTASDNWGTDPKDFASIDVLCRMIYNRPIVCDAAASLENRHVDTWFGPDHPDSERRDALSSAWEGPSFLNPPYSRIAEFAAHAAMQLDPVLMLCYLRLDTKWSHECVLPLSNVIYVRKGRCVFQDPVSGRLGASAPAPSMLVCFGEPERTPIATRQWYPLFPGR